MQEFLTDAKTGVGCDEFDEEAGHFHCLKVSPQGLLISCKKKNSNYVVKKSGNVFDQLNKISTTNKGQVDITCLQM